MIHKEISSSVFVLRHLVGKKLFKHALPRLMSAPWARKKKMGALSVIFLSNLIFQSAILNSPFWAAMVQIAF